MQTTNNKIEKGILTRDLMLDLSMPIIMIIVSILLVFMVYMPIVREIKELKEQTVNVHQEVVELKAKKSVVSQKTPEELTMMLNKLTKMVPDYINIGALGKFINQIAQKHGLKVRTLNLSQSQISVDDKDITTLNTRLNVKVIQGPFSLVGTKDDIFSFLDFLVTGPYATEFGAVNVTGGNSFFWNVSFTAVHYYFPKVVDIDVKAPLIRPNWTEVKEVLKYKANENEPSASSEAIGPTGSITPSISPEPSAEPVEQPSLGEPPV